MEYYSAKNKNKVLSFVTIWMYLEGIKLKWNKSDTEIISYVKSNKKKERIKHNKAEIES